MSRLPDIQLDDRRFQDLVSEARLRITRTCPEWTEHNVSDPGITLIELFAWMTEMTIFRLNRVPDKLHVTLLELLGIQLDGPSSAATDVRFRLAAAPEEESVQIAGGETEIATPRTPNEESIVFQVDETFEVPAAVPTSVPARIVSGSLATSGSRKRRLVCAALGPSSRMPSSSRRETCSLSGTRLSR